MKPREFVLLVCPVCAAAACLEEYGEPLTCNGVTERHPRRRMDVVRVREVADG
jgi:hypothetical protein